MTFLELLNKYNIPYETNKEKDGTEIVLVNDWLLIPYEKEIRNNYPEFEFYWDYQRYRNEPKRVNDELHS